MNRKDFAINFLREEGVPDIKIHDVISGFDWHRHVEIRMLEEGDHLYQYVRRASHGYSMPRLGNWYSLKGSGMNDLAIMSGGTGRFLAPVIIKYPCRALEGAASKMQLNWLWEGGGAGGGTQLFLPDKYIIPCVEIMGFDV